MLQTRQYFVSSSALQKPYFYFYKLRIYIPYEIYFFNSKSVVIMAYKL